MAEKICGIYCIENIINGKKYIGQSVNIKRRWHEHKSSLNLGNSTSTHLQHAWTMYKEENFIFYILELCNVESLDDKESYYIDLYNTTSNMYGYNIESGGHANKRISDETRQKLSEVLTGRTFSDEHRRKIGLALSGRVFSLESREKMSQSRVGKMKGKDHPGCKPIYCFELDEYFWGAAEAEEKYGINRSYISANLIGNQKSAGKHPVTGEKLHWDYVENLQTQQVC